MASPYPHHAGYPPQSAYPSHAPFPHHQQPPPHLQHTLAPMASSAGRPPSPQPPPPPPVRLYQTLEHHVVSARYATSGDSRGYIACFEYTAPSLGGNTILIDSDTGHVHWTGIWKALGHTKADIVKLLDSTPGIAPLIRKVRGGCLKIQGTWIAFETAQALARRCAWPIRYDLVPLFGPNFPDTCLTPDSAGFGHLSLSPPGRRKPKRLNAKAAATLNAARSASTAGYPAPLYADQHVPPPPPPHPHPHPHAHPHAIPPPHPHHQLPPHPHAPPLVQPHPQPLYQAWTPVPSPAPSAPGGWPAPPPGPATPTPQQQLRAFRFPSGPPPTHGRVEHPQRGYSVDPLSPPPTVGRAPSGSSSRQQRYAPYDTSRRSPSVMSTPSAPHVGSRSASGGSGGSPRSLHRTLAPISTLGLPPLSPMRSSTLSAAGDAASTLLKLSLGSDAPPLPPPQAYLRQRRSSSAPAPDRIPSLFVEGPPPASSQSTYEASYPAQSRGRDEPLFSHAPPSLPPSPAGSLPSLSSGHRNSPSTSTIGEPAYLPPPMLAPPATPVGGGGSGGGSGSSLFSFEAAAAAARSASPQPLARSCGPSPPPVTEPSPTQRSGAFRPW